LEAIDYDFYSEDLPARSETHLQLPLKLKIVDADPLISLALRYPETVNVSRAPTSTEKEKVISMCAETKNVRQGHCLLAPYPIYPGVHPKRRKTRRIGRYGIDRENFPKLCLECKRGGKGSQ